MFHLLSAQGVVGRLAASLGSTELRKGITGISVALGFSAVVAAKAGPWDFAVLYRHGRRPALGCVS